MAEERWWLPQVDERAPDVAVEAHEARGAAVPRLAFDLAEHEQPAQRGLDALVGKLEEHGCLPKTTAPSPTPAAVAAVTTSQLSASTSRTTSHGGAARALVDEQRRKDGEREHDVEHDGQAALQLDGNAARLVDALRRA